mmetsp:Transcript_15533/g.23503  ORF Transcript_15533/g.23503 Transcript_15533/m.23503 type:complete len:621 (-) Transcript_15533:88-1950(-)
MSVKEAAVMEVEVQNINGFKVHASHTCDGCNVSPIVGKRFKSSDTANFDLCSKCFAAYDGDELFEETLLARDRKSTKDYVLKIKTNDGPESTQIRRINVADVWGEDDKLSYAKLIAAASKFASIEDVDNSKAKVTYIDGDGDRITISSDGEFTDSFRQTIKPRKPFRVTVLFPTGDGVKPAPAAAAGPVKNPQKLFRIERQIAKKSNELEALKVKAKLASARPPVADGEQKPIGWMNAEKFDSSFFIHARHTCDGCSKSPIIGTRYRATNIPDFDFCANCFNKYEGEKTDFKPEALERDRKMQQRWLRKHLSNSRMCEIHSSPACEGFRRPSKQGEAEQKSEEQNPVEAAIGFLKTMSPAIAQSLKDVEIHVSPPCQGFSEAAKPKSEEQGPKEGTPAEASKPDEEEESIKTAHKSGSSDSKDDSFFSDADGNSIAEVIGKTLDVCVQAMEDAMLDDAVQKSSKDVADAAAAAAADAFSVASSIADALKNSDEFNSVTASAQTDASAAKVAEDEGLKTEEQSNTEDDWSVVTDENEMVETKNKAEEIKEEESDKSVTSVEPISAVVLAKWDTELKQLHELGFLDDRINTNALEQLEASHLGCGSDEVVTVNAAVEHILKD